MSWFTKDIFPTTATLPSNGASLDFNVITSPSTSTTSGSARFIIAPTTSEQNPTRFYALEFLLDFPIQSEGDADGEESSSASSSRCRPPRVFSGMRRVIGSKSFLAINPPSTLHPCLPHKNGTLPNKMRLSLAFFSSKSSPNLPSEEKVEVELRPTEVESVSGEAWVLGAVLPMDSVFQDMKEHGFDVHFAASDETSWSVESVGPAPEKSRSRSVTGSVGGGAAADSGNNNNKGSLFTQEDFKSLPETIPPSTIVVPSASNNCYHHQQQQTVTTTTFTTMSPSPQNPYFIMMNNNNNQNNNSSSCFMPPQQMCPPPVQQQQQPKITPQHFQGMPSSFPVDNSVRPYQPIMNNNANNNNHSNRAGNRTQYAEEPAFEVDERNIVAGTVISGNNNNNNQQQQQMKDEPSVPQQQQQQQQQQYQSGNSLNDFVSVNEHDENDDDDDDQQNLV